MKPQHRYIMPGDHAHPLPLDLNRAEAITLLNSLIEEIEAFEEKGESVYKLNRLAEKLEGIISKNEKSKP